MLFPTEYGNNRQTTPLLVWDSKLQESNRTEKHEKREDEDRSINVATDHSSCVQVNSFTNKASRRCISPTNPTPNRRVRLESFAEEEECKEAEKEGEPVKKELTETGLILETLSMPLSTLPGSHNILNGSPNLHSEMRDLDQFSEEKYCEGNTAAEDSVYEDIRNRIFILPK
ncbi:hypothetical protein CHS0354_032124 [Potamilus streckersoni]|uniref:Uncharacterized protein n=1 Tax=Potamilus streckersoni TaxID=2493646 RepID=A0AAE0SFA9_9BIVA|nr:hypothetical protein CHS0354_032124 [Potamilus streckersoni]